MGDVIRATAINYLNFFKKAYKKYKATDKDTRMKTALNRIEKFIKKQPTIENFMREEIKKIKNEIN